MNVVNIDLNALPIVSGVRRVTSDTVAIIDEISSNSKPTSRAVFAVRVKPVAISAKSEPEAAPNLAKTSVIYVAACPPRSASKSKPLIVEVKYSDI